jgi:type II secretory pathway pseudopilin PulG
MRRGFSLVELMVLIVIAGLILGVGLPAFLDYQETQVLRPAPHQVRTDIETARQTAIERRFPVILGFGRPPSTLYTMHFDMNGNGRVDPGEGTRICELPQGTLFTRIGLEPADTLWFEPNGTLKPGSRGGTIVIRNARYADTLRVSPTGAVELR